MKRADIRKKLLKVLDIAPEIRDILLADADIKDDPTIKDAIYILRKTA